MEAISGLGSINDLGPIIGWEASSEMEAISDLRSTSDPGSMGQNKDPLKD